MGLEQVRVLELPKIVDARGNLTFIESARHIPFQIQRVYYLYDIPGGATRGGHAHRELEQFLIAASGSFEVLLDDGRERRTVMLNRPYQGLYIPRLVWRELLNFSSGSVCLVLASRPYEETDYFRDYERFVREAVGSRRPSSPAEERRSGGAEGQGSTGAEGRRG